MEAVGAALVISRCCVNAVITAKNKEKVDKCPVCDRSIRVTEFIRSKVFKIMKKAK